MVEIKKSLVLTAETVEALAWRAIQAEKRVEELELELKEATCDQPTMKLLTTVMDERDVLRGQLEVMTQDSKFWKEEYDALVDKLCKVYCPECEDYHDGPSCIKPQKER